MNLYQNDDRIAKIFISGTKQVFWDREKWKLDMIVIPALSVFNGEE